MRGYAGGALLQHQTISFTFKPASAGAVAFRQRKKKEEAAAVLFWNNSTLMF